MTRPLFPVLVVTALLLAGCLSGDPESVETAAVAANAEDAGAVSGPAPAAPKEAYQVRASPEEGEPALTAYPATLRTGGPKPPFVTELTGTFEPTACNPSGGVPLGGFGLSEPTKIHALSDALASNDVFGFDIQLTYTNTAQSWASLHLWYQFAGSNDYWSQPTEGEGVQTMNFTGQALALGDSPAAAIGVDCWYGAITSPIDYVITVTLSFAEGGVPAATPVLLDVPADATRLIVRGVALDADQGVQSHFRVFAPDDSLVCECALGSSQEVAIQALDMPGAYVVLVDHTANGFVSLALDAPGEHTLAPLETEFVTYPVYSNPQGGAVDETILLDLPSTPLTVWGWVVAPGDWTGPPDAGAGHNVRITMSNARGDVIRIAMAGYVTYHAAAPGAFATNDWYAVPIDGDWEFYQDHHAYDLGQHTVSVKADQLRGDIRVFAQHYVRG